MAAVAGLLLQTLNKTLLQALLRQLGSRILKYVHADFEKAAVGGLMDHLSLSHISLNVAQVNADLHALQLPFRVAAGSVDKIEFNLYLAHAQLHIILSTVHITVSPLPDFAFFAPCWNSAAAAAARADESSTSAERKSASAEAAERVGASSAGARRGGGGPPTGAPFARRDETPAAASGGGYVGCGVLGASEKELFQVQITKISNHAEACTQALRLAKIQRQLERVERQLRQLQQRALLEHAPGSPHYAAVTAAIEGFTQKYRQLQREQLLLRQQQQHSHAELVGSTLPLSPAGATTTTAAAVGNPLGSNAAAAAGVAAAAAGKAAAGGAKVAGVAATGDTSTQTTPTTTTTTTGALLAWLLRYMPNIKVRVDNLNLLFDDSSGILLQPMRCCLHADRVLLQPDHRGMWSFQWPSGFQQSSTNTCSPNQSKKVGSFNNRSENEPGSRLWLDWPASRRASQEECSKKSSHFQSTGSASSALNSGSSSTRISVSPLQFARAGASRSKKFSAAATREQRQQPQQQQQSLRQQKLHDRCSAAAVSSLFFTGEETVAAAKPAVYATAGESSARDLTYAVSLEGFGFYWEDTTRGAAASAAAAGTTFVGGLNSSERSRQEGQQQQPAPLRAEFGMQQKQQLVLSAAAVSTASGMGDSGGGAAEEREFYRRWILRPLDLQAQLGLHSPAAAAGAPTGVAPAANFSGDSGAASASALLLLQKNSAAEATLPEQMIAKVLLRCDSPVEIEIDDGLLMSAALSLKKLQHLQRVKDLAVFRPTARPRCSRSSRQRSRAAAALKFEQQQTQHKEQQHKAQEHTQRLQGTASSSGAGSSVGESSEESSREDEESAENDEIEEEEEATAFRRKAETVPAPAGGAVLSGCCWWGFSAAAAARRRKQRRSEGTCRQWWAYALHYVRLLRQQQQAGDSSGISSAPSKTWWGISSSPSCSRSSSSKNSSKNSSLYWGRMEERIVQMKRYLRIVKTYASMQRMQRLLYGPQVASAAAKSAATAGASSLESVAVALDSSSNSSEVDLLLHCMKSSTSSGSLGGVLDGKDAAAAAAHAAAASTAAGTLLPQTSDLKSFFLWFWDQREQQLLQRFEKRLFKRQQRQQEQQQRRNAARISPQTKTVSGCLAWSKKHCERSKNRRGRVGAATAEDSDDDTDAAFVVRLVLQRPYWAVAQWHLLALAELTVAEQKQKQQQQLLSEQQLQQLHQPCTHELLLSPLLLQLEKEQQLLLGAKQRFLYSLRQYPAEAAALAAASDWQRSGKRPSMLTAASIVSSPELLQAQQQQLLSMQQQVNRTQKKACKVLQRQHREAIEWFDTKPRFLRLARAASAALTKLQAVKQQQQQQQQKNQLCQAEATGNEGSKTEVPLAAAAVVVEGSSSGTRDVLSQQNHHQLGAANAQADAAKTLEEERKRLTAEYVAAASQLRYDVSWSRSRDRMLCWADFYRSYAQAFPSNDRSLVDVEQLDLLLQQQHAAALSLAESSGLVVKRAARRCTVSPLATTAAAPTTAEEGSSSSDSAAALNESQHKHQEPLHQVVLPPVPPVLEQLLEGSPLPLPRFLQRKLFGFYFRSISVCIAPRVLPPFLPSSNTTTTSTTTTSTTTTTTTTTSSSSLFPVRISLQRRQEQQQRSRVLSWVAAEATELALCFRSFEELSLQICMRSCEVVQLRGWRSPSISSRRTSTSRIRSSCAFAPPVKTAVSLQQQQRSPFVNNSNSAVVYAQCRVRSGEKTPHYAEARGSPAAATSFVSGFNSFFSHFTSNSSAAAAAGAAAARRRVQPLLLQRTVTTLGRLNAQNRQVLLRLAHQDPLQKQQKQQQQQQQQKHQQQQQQQQQQQPAEEEGAAVLGRQKAAGAAITKGKEGAAASAEEGAPGAQPERRRGSDEESFFELLQVKVKRSDSVSSDSSGACSTTAPAPAAENSLSSSCGGGSEKKQLSAFSGSSRTTSRQSSGSEFRDSTKESAAAAVPQALVLLHRAFQQAVQQKQLQQQQLSKKYLFFSAHLLSLPLLKNELRLGLPLHCSLFFHGQHAAASASLQQLHSCYEDLYAVAAAFFQTAARCDSEMGLLQKLPAHPHSDWKVEFYSELLRQYEAYNEKLALEDTAVVTKARNAAGKSAAIVVAASATATAATAAHLPPPSSSGATTTTIESIPLKISTALHSNSSSGSSGSTKETAFPMLHAETVCNQAGREKSYGARLGVDVTFLLDRIAALKKTSSSLTTHATTAAETASSSTNLSTTDSAPKSTSAASPSPLHGGTVIAAVVDAAATSAAHPAVPPGFTGDQPAHSLLFAQTEQEQETQKQPPQKALSCEQEQQEQKKQGKEMQRDESHLLVLKPSLEHLQELSKQQFVEERSEQQQRVASQQQPLLCQTRQHPKLSKDKQRNEEDANPLFEQTCPGKRATDAEAAESGGAAAAVVGNHPLEVSKIAATDWSAFSAPFAEEKEQQNRSSKEDCVRLQRRAAAAAFSGASVPVFPLDLRSQPQQQRQPRHYQWEEGEKDLFSNEVSTEPPATHWLREKQAKLLDEWRKVAAALPLLLLQIQLNLPGFSLVVLEAPHFSESPLRPTTKQQSTRKEAASFFAGAAATASAAVLPAVAASCKSRSVAPRLIAFAANGQLEALKPAKTNEEEGEEEEECAEFSESVSAVSSLSACTLRKDESSCRSEQKVLYACQIHPQTVCLYLSRSNNNGNNNGSRVFFTLTPTCVNVAFSPISFLTALPRLLQLLREKIELLHFLLPLLQARLSPQLPQNFLAFLQQRMRLFQQQNQRTDSHSSCWSEDSCSCSSRSAVHSGSSSSTTTHNDNHRKKGMPALVQRPLPQQMQKLNEKQQQQQQQPQFWKQQQPVERGEEGPENKRNGNDENPLRLLENNSSVGSVGLARGGTDGDVHVHAEQFLKNAENAGVKNSSQESKLVSLQKNTERQQRRQLNSADDVLDSKGLLLAQEETAAAVRASYKGGTLRHCCSFSSSCRQASSETARAQAAAPQQPATATTAKKTAGRAATATAANAAGNRPHGDVVKIKMQPFFHAPNQSISSASKVLSNNLNSTSQRSRSSFDDKCSSSNNSGERQSCCNSRTNVQAEQFHSLSGFVLPKYVEDDDVEVQEEEDLPAETEEVQKKLQQQQQTDQPLCWPQEQQLQANGSQEEAESKRHQWCHSEQMMQQAAAAETAENTNAQPVQDRNSLSLLRGFERNPSSSSSSPCSDSSSNNSSSSGTSKACCKLALISDVETADATATGSVAANATSTGLTEENESVVRARKDARDIVLGETAAVGVDHNYGSSSHSNMLLSAASYSPSAASTTAAGTPAAVNIGSAKSEKDAVSPSISTKASCLDSHNSSRNNDFDSAAPTGADAVANSWGFAAALGGAAADAASASSGIASHVRKSSHFLSRMTWKRTLGPSSLEETAAPVGENSLLSPLAGACATAAQVSHTLEANNGHAAASAAALSLTFAHHHHAAAASDAAHASGVAKSATYAVAAAAAEQASTADSVGGDEKEKRSGETLHQQQQQQQRWKVLGRESGDAAEELKTTKPAKKSNPFRLFRV